MYKKYNRETYSELERQHNIFVLVGNGFDIAVLDKYKDGLMKGKSTSYSDFFDYITYYNLCDNKNVLYNKMSEDKINNRDNWCDFENTISELMNHRGVDNVELEGCVDEFQAHFTRFLNEIVDADVLLNLNYDSQKNGWARHSLAHFLDDQRDSIVDFSNKTGHYDLFYFVFANFNYTSLLDNYLYLDKTQFDPHYWKSADRNFQFYLNQNNSPNTSWSSYLVYDIVHPNGIQDIPRSILFGTYMDSYDKGRSREKRLIKDYWAQYDVKYKSYIEEAELIIIYGMSLGKTDGWWMDNIYDAILNRDVELVIYMYGNYDEDNVKNKFIDACLKHKNDLSDTIMHVKEKIFVITFNENNTHFLGFNEA